MNKIIVVGHPQSGLERVEELLLACGMAQALPSRREGFTPMQISETLVKVHGAVPVQHVRTASELQQIAVAPVWQGLALDLMLANMEQPLWGWADPQAAYLLDYWKTQDPQTMFVLVYDAPQSALIRHTIERLETDPEELQVKVDNWMAYNAALLNFHLRNTDRSLLVHAEQVQTSVPYYLQQLSARIDTALQLPGVSTTQQSTTCGSTQSVSNAEEAIPMPEQQTGAQTGLQDSALAQWLVRQLMEEYPEAAELHAQLQAAASMPLRTQQSGQALSLAKGDLQSKHLYQAWTAFVAQQVAVQQSAACVLQLEKTLHNKEQQLLHSHSQIEQLHEACLAAQQREQEGLVNGNLIALQNSKQENELLIVQLHQVQEALEKQHLHIQEQAKKLTDLQVLRETQTEIPQKHMFEQASNNPAFIGLREENELLLIQLQQVQEELERYYLENRQLKQGALVTQTKAYYGAADRVKQQLSYRLGSTMIVQSRSLGGWLRMPFALRAEARSFRQDQAARGNKKLPAITLYCDLHEAEKVKQHLSYRLGARMIANSKTLSGWISMPWALLSEVKGFQNKRKSSGRAAV